MLGPSRTRSGTLTDTGESLRPSSCRTAAILTRQLLQRAGLGGIESTLRAIHSCKNSNPTTAPAPWGSGPKARRYRLGSGANWVPLVPGPTGSGRNGEALGVRSNRSLKLSASSPVAGRFNFRLPRTRLPEALLAGRFRNIESGRFLHNSTKSSQKLKFEFLPSPWGHRESEHQRSLQPTCCSRSRAARDHQPHVERNRVAE